MSGPAVLLGVLAAGMLVGCGGTSGLPVSASPRHAGQVPATSAPGATSAPPVARVDNLRDLDGSVSGAMVTKAIAVRPGHITILPAPAELASRALPADEAYQAFLRTHLFASTAAQEPHTQVLGLITNSDYGPLAPDGRVVLAMDHYPAWFVIFHDVPDDLGPFGGQGTDTQQQHVNIVVILDAVTGKYVAAVNDTVNQDARAGGAGPGPVLTQ